MMAAAAAAAAAVSSVRYHIPDSLLAALSSAATFPSTSSFATLLHACSRLRLLLLGRSLHRRLLLLPPSPSPFLSNHLLNMYAQCGRLDLARHVFNSMTLRNLVSYTALLTAYIHHGLHDLAFHLLPRMLPHHIPNEFALAAALSSCTAAFHPLRGYLLHALATKTSLNINPFVANALITFYSTTDVDSAWLVFCSLPTKTLVSYNSMIAAFLRNHQPGNSLTLFGQMHRASLPFDRATLLGVIPSCTDLRHCGQLHCLAIKTNSLLEVEVATAFVKSYSALEGDFDEYYKIFCGAKDHDIVSWTGIMTSCADKEPEKAALLFHQLRHEGPKPDRYTFSIAVKVSAGFATARYCSSLHPLILKSGFGDDTVVLNALIHAYARCGSIDSAEHIFEQLMDRDEVSWNSMIKAYAAHGRGKEAISIFEDMVKHVAPDSATFVGLLTACSHGGLVDEGRGIFKMMHEVYNISPQLDHYACMVDILGRNGNIKEAYDLIDELPVRPDSVIWSALLGACRKHGEMQIGEKAAKKLMELEPKNSIGYVMISNLYCESGNLGDGAFARKEMKVCGVKKEPGLSWIEIANRVHEFSAGARRHPQRELIYVELYKLAEKLKEMGYVAQTRLVFHETLEEDKKDRLLLHSEKLALAFALINPSAVVGSVRIMKNIRICEDCHNFIRLASKCIGKEIVVRDANRFHHFVAGVCSCGDYW
ncbi:pentatricopeptide repeat-containing protein At1g71420 [Ananas comosus]|uniref:Pentatricopeptide repeat-containing protein n=1 Tax=Ananas comosus TaxID=4615 RepID=A0A199UG35_ANACO|nr:pentatricopeptide repeat-containing protein At1g71420 [Ananas comosus]XP_020106452.1 pentatricopeptide repeat-containing protein At1g71420 [Ananas comosus]XP_020106460.1 pentatricopeptide repeat-containing protein At1g71420 [Ananas comosus]XP_020106469.1 pentatricopeptide repeat-containing protein At1g71420 [Ananas comosus]OAY63699.1 Pentatricopeptide repeat-containing protein [Ananas comosus]